MSRIGQAAHLLAATCFVVGGLVLAFRPRPLPRLSQLEGSDGPLFSLAPALGEATSGILIPQLYVRPENPLMWALLLAVMLMVIQDAAGQWIDPSENPSMPVWPVLGIALMAGSLGPWLLGWAAPAAAICLILAAATATAAAIRAAGQQRSAPGFLAGWMTGLAVAATAAVLATAGRLSTGQTAILAILPAAVIGMAVQRRLARAFGYSAALIWAFCALTITTMGSAPTTALAAILGIAAMTAALIRSAS